MMPEEVLPRPKPMKSDDLEAFLEILGPPTRAHFNLVHADTRQLDEIVKGILPGFKGHLMSPDIKYESWDKSQPMTESREDYTQNLLAAYRTFEIIQQALLKDGYKDIPLLKTPRLQIEKLGWELDQEIRVDIITCPPKIICYTRQSRVDYDILDRLKKMADEKRIPCVTSP